MIKRFLYRCQHVLQHIGRQHHIVYAQVLRRGLQNVQVRGLVKMGVHIRHLARQHIGIAGPVTHAQATHIRALGPIH